MLSVRVPPAFTVLELDVTETEVESSVLDACATIGLPNKIPTINEDSMIVASKEDFVTKPTTFENDLIAIKGSNIDRVK